MLDAFKSPEVQEDIPPRSQPGQSAVQRSVWLAVVLTSLFWLLAGGLVLLFWQHPRPVAFEIQPPPATATPRPSPTPSPTSTPAPLLVDVAGAVQRPGVYQLPAGSRVQQAIDVAGGVTAEAELRLVNLARPLHDGEKLYVPAKGEEAPPSSTGSTAQTGTAPANGTATAFPININTASAQELEALPGIGPVTAQAIVAYRQANGPFSSVKQIVEVKGIGEGTLAKIRDLITVGP